MIHQKKNRGHRTPKIVKSRKSYSNGHLPYHLLIYYLAPAPMHDVACEFACAVGCAETISAKVLKLLKGVVNQFAEDNIVPVIIPHTSFFCSSTIFSWPSWVFSCSASQVPRSIVCNAAAICSCSRRRTWWRFFTKHMNLTRNYSKQCSVIRDSRLKIITRCNALFDNKVG